ncbi:flavin-containing monooxygenase 9 [Thozetella sp. PMI_491]|nr:flavin-containing monooxygenase 9 [Thozetella sp. PMI_491]
MALAAKVVPTVAVVGAGPSGLSMLKTLCHDGLKATLFERRSQVGGLWAYTDDTTMTSVLPTTTALISKYVCGFSDFPMPDKYPHHLTRAQFQEYMEDYATHFDLWKHIVFNASVKTATRNEDDTKWVLKIEVDGDLQSHVFDKVVFCHGYQSKKVMPHLADREKFEGPVIHSQEYRSPDKFKGQKVVVVGLGPSATEIIDTLLPVASQLYASHRRGAIVGRKWRKGTPLDLQVTWRRRQVGLFMQSHFPGMMKWAADLASAYLMHETWGKLDPAWRFKPFPSIVFNPTAAMSDILIPALRKGKVISMHGIKRFTGPRSIEFQDGTILEDIDAVICATGYEADFSVAPFLKTSRPPNYNGPEIARLWKNMFHPQYATSMCLLCYSTFGKSNGFSYNDLISMAISNVLSGTHPVPSPEQMEKDIDRDQAWVASRWRLDNHFTPAAVKQWEYQAFLHDAAGTGMENLGWGWKGWKFWFQDPKMSHLMNHGLETAHAYRYFETGKRKAWPGARDAIIHVNESIKVFPVKEPPVPDI